MKVESEADIIHAIQQGVDVDFPNRRAYEEGRSFLLNFAEYCVDENHWHWFQNIQEQIEKADQDWAPPGGWPSPN